jgi:hypothetical protein
MADAPTRLAEAAPTSNGNGNASHQPQPQMTSIDHSSNSATMASSSSSQARSSNNNNNHNGSSAAAANVVDAAAVGYLSTGALEQRLRKLRDESNAQSQLLTQKLAESQSGQNLLHMSTRLSTLPPLLHALLQQLHPVLNSAEQAEKGTLDQLQRIRQQVVNVRVEQRRASHAVECSNLYQDVLSAERILQQQQQQQQRVRSTKKNPLHNSSGTSTGVGRESFEVLCAPAHPLFSPCNGLFLLRCR